MAVETLTNKTFGVPNKNASLNITRTNYNLNDINDLKTCIKAVCPSMTLEAVELWAHCMKDKNRELFMFLDRYVGSLPQGQSININVTVKDDDPYEALN